MRWNDEWDRKLLSLRDGREAGHTTPSFAQVAEKMSEWFNLPIRKDQVQKRYQMLVDGEPLKSGVDFPPADPTPYLRSYFDEEGNYRGPRQPKQDWKSHVARLFADPSRWVSTLVLSDQQGVFADEHLIDGVLLDNPDVDLIVLAGDVADWEGASRFDHTADYPLAHEADWLVRHLRVLTERYPDVPILLTDSNHRRRVTSTVRRSLPPGLLFLADPNIERVLSQPFPTVHALDSWWVQIGDWLYAHKEGRTVTPGSNVRDAIITFGNWQRSGQFPIQPFRGVLTGHSHKVCELFETGVKGIEPGCLARLPMGYLTTAKTKSVQENGYAVIVQRGGKADLNACRSYRLAPARSDREWVA